MCGRAWEGVGGRIELHANVMNERTFCVCSTPTQRLFTDYFASIHSTFFLSSFVLAFLFPCFLPCFLLYRVWWTWATGGPNSCMKPIYRRASDAHRQTSILLLLAFFLFFSHNLIYMKPQFCHNTQVLRNTCI